jgi:hypothetical protein
MRLFLAILLLIPSLVNAAALDLEKDNDGWTVFAPSVSSRIVYISTSGSTDCPYYNKDDAAIGGDPFNPTGPIQPCSTYTVAVEKTRDNYPDWILFKRGDVFIDRLHLVRRGLSASEPTVIAAYGSTGASPVLTPPVGQHGVTIERESAGAPGVFQYAAISGLDFYFELRDPTSPNYMGSTDAYGLNIGALNAGNAINHLLVEGCRFRYPTKNNLNAGTGAVSADITIRRNLFTYAYSESALPQGIGASGVSNLLIEDNILYHNGWLIQSLGSGAKTGGQATQHNHSVYLSYNCDNSIIRKNISIAPSSIHFKVNGDNLISPTVEDNLAIDGEIGVDMSNNYGTTEFRVKSPKVRGNILSHINMSRPLNRDVAWGFWLHGWDGGELKDNLVLSSAWIYKIGDQSRNSIISGNTLYQSPNLYAGEVDTYGTTSNITVTNNYFEIAGGASAFFMARTPFNEGIAFSGNHYYTQETSAQFLFDDEITQVTYTFDQWKVNFEPSAIFAQHSFPDPTRSIETYMASLGETATLDAFIAKARTQDRYNWDPRFTADVVNSWIRAGFGMGQRRFFRNVRLHTEVEP